MAFEVTGIPRGLYHYSVRENALVRLRSEVARDDVMRFTWGQGWFGDAAAVFLLTAVFGRTMWKYRTPQAYRVLLLETGHLCQNLVLTATSLGLGAFQAAALDAPAIDHYLGLDGVNEGVVYLAGIGWPDRKRFRRAARNGLLPGGPL
jgi:SagB-type dehydrogenase family enzyme